MYEKLVAELRAGYTDPFVLDGAADAIEELTATAESYKRSMEAWADESARAQPRWIPVTERLPDVGETVWAVYKNSLFANARSFYKTLKYDGEIWTDENGYRYLQANITHWQERDPLPEPPKEE